MVDASGGESKVESYKKQYCIGIWNVGSKNQGELDMVKREMARVNIDILGINELKWMGMGEFNSDDHYIYYCGQESHIVKFQTLVDYESYSIPSKGFLPTETDTMVI